MKFLDWIIFLVVFLSLPVGIWSGVPFYTFLLVPVIYGIAFIYCILRLPIILFKKSSGKQRDFSQCIPLVLSIFVPLLYLHGNAIFAVDWIRVAFEPKFSACAESAKPVDEKGRLGVCEMRSDSENDYSIVYDSTGEILLKPKNRSKQWENVYHSFNAVNHNMQIANGSQRIIRRIIGHYYEVSCDYVVGASYGEERSGCS